MAAVPREGDLRPSQASPPPERLCSRLRGAATAPVRWFINNHMPQNGVPFARTLTPA